MKEVEVIIGIIFIILGAILFSINWNSIIKFLGLTLLSTGVIIYVVTIDNLDRTKKKEIQKRDIVQQFLPLK